MISMRQEEAGDATKIFDLVCQAFGREDEARLLEDLVTEGDALISLVAVNKDEDVVGHILFSDAPTGTTLNLLRGAVLAPLSIAKAYEGQGIGGGLIMQGLRECRKSGIQVVLVLGEPDYYARFGFSSETARRLESPYSGDTFQALEMSSGVLEGVTGKVLYAEAFARVGQGSLA